MKSGSYYFVIPKSIMLSRKNHILGWMQTYYLLFLLMVVTSTGRAQIQLKFDTEGRLQDLHPQDLILKQGDEERLCISVNNGDMNAIGKQGTDEIAKRFKNAAEKLSTTNTSSYPTALARLGGVDSSWIDSLRNDYRLLEKYFTGYYGGRDSTYLDSLTIFKESHIRSLHDSTKPNLRLMAEASACLPAGLRGTVTNCTEERSRGLLGEGASKTSFEARLEQLLRDLHLLAPLSPEERIKTGPCSNESFSVKLIQDNVDRAFIRGMYERLYDTYGPEIKAFDCKNCRLAPNLEALASLYRNYRSVATGLRDCDCDQHPSLSACSPYLDTVFYLTQAVYPDSIIPGLIDALPAVDPQLVEWMFATMWMHGKEDYALNPLPFTDKGYLPTKPHDKEKARRFDAYIDSLLIDMEDNDRLSPGRLNVALFDSLQQLKGTGSKLYDNRKHNDSLLRDNRLNRDKFFAGARNTLHQVDFAVVKKPGALPTVALWNTEEGKFRRLVKPFPEAVVSKRPAFVIANNIKSEHSVELGKVKSTDISETSSSTIGGIAKILPLIAGVAEPLILVRSVTSGLFSTKENAVGKKTVIVAGGSASSQGGKLSIHTVKDSISDTASIDTIDCKTFLYSFDVNDLPDTTLLAYIRPPGAGRITVTPDIDTIVDLLGRLSSDQVGTLWLETGKSVCTRLTPVARDLLRLTITRVACDEGRRYATNNLRFDPNALPELKGVIRADFYRQLDTLSQTFNEQYRTLGRLVDQWGDAGRWVLPPDPESFPQEPAAPPPPRYKTRVLPLPSSTTAKEHTFSVYERDGERKIVDSLALKYKSVAGNVLTISGGFTQTFDGNNDIRRYEVTEADGKLTTEVDDDHFRPFVAVHLHPFRMINVYDRFLFWDGLPLRDQLSRVSIFLGASFPKPLYNLHTGIGIDWLPGIKTVFGYHWYRETKYEIVNNTIAGQRSRYRGAGLSIGLTLDPVAIASITELFE
jgi:hypothetical protein